MFCLEDLKIFLRNRTFCRMKSKISRDRIDEPQISNRIHGPQISNRIHVPQISNQIDAADSTAPRQHLCKHLKSAYGAFFLKEL